MYSTTNTEKFSLQQLSYNMIFNFLNTSMIYIIDKKLTTIPLSLSYIIIISKYLTDEIFIRT